MPLRNCDKDDGEHHIWKEVVCHVADDLFFVDWLWNMMCACCHTAGCCGCVLYFMVDVWYNFESIAEIISFLLLLSAGVNILYMCAVRVYEDERLWR